MVGVVPPKVRQKNKRNDIWLSIMNLEPVNHNLTLIVTILVHKNYFWEHFEKKVKYFPDVIVNVVSG